MMTIIEGFKIPLILENKQIEATILNQAIAKGEQRDHRSSGKTLVAEKIKSLGSDLSVEELSNMTLKELIKYSKDNNIDTQELFLVAAGNIDAVVGTGGYISKDEARKTALNLVDGEIIKLEIDDLRDDDDSPEYEIEIIKDGVRYEIEIDAFSGRVKEFERDDDDKTRKVASENVNIEVAKDRVDKDNKRPSKNKGQSKSKGRISFDEAKKIALDLVNGTIIEFELDDDEYEIEIVKDGIEYEIEIDAYTGKVLKFERD